MGGGGGGGVGGLGLPGWGGGGAVGVSGGVRGRLGCCGGGFPGPFCGWVKYHDDGTV